MTGVPDTPTEPAVEVKLMVPVPLTFKPPEKVPALLMLPAEVRLMLLVLATVPTAPASPNDPVVAVSDMVVPVILTPAPEFRLPAPVTLNTLPAPELLVTVVVPAIESDKYTFCPADVALAEKFGELTTTGAPESPIEPEVDVRLTVPVAAFVVTLAELIDALEVNVTVLVVVVPTVPASPSAPAVAVRLIVVPVIFVAAPEFKLPAAVKLNTLPAPESELTVVVAALESDR